MSIHLFLYILFLLRVCTSLKWPEKYTAEGKIILPYAEISEPFRAVVDKSVGMSLLSTYDGTVIVT